jgi:hypothetical protein
MTASNFTRSLQAFARRRPFKTFEVELLSGDRFLVEHPEALAYGGTVAVYVNPGGEIRLFDSESVSQAQGCHRPAVGLDG